MASLCIQKTSRDLRAATALLVTTIVLVLGAGAPAHANDGGNLLLNPGFDEAGGSLNEWTFFENVFTNVAGEPTQSAPGSAKMFGSFNGAPSGLFQGVPAVAGQTFRMSAFSQVTSVDPLTGSGAPNDNFAVMKIVFVDGGGFEITSEQTIIADGTVPQDLWQFHDIMATAPAGTTEVRAFFLFFQPNFDSGSVFVDDAALCEIVTGACCLDDGTCSEVTGVACDGMGGSYLPGVACALAGCDDVPCNLLDNRSFDQGGGSFTGWTTFGNALISIPGEPFRSAPASAKMFGTGGIGDTGGFQAFPNAGGQAYRMTAWSRVRSLDPLVGNGSPDSNFAVMKIAYFDAAIGGTEIGGDELIIADGTTQQDVWRFHELTGTSPAGTMRAEALFIFIQPDNDGGAVFVDDATFCALEPACCFGTGTCQVLIADDCNAAGGTPVPPGATCADRPCAAPCCMPGDGCTTMLPADCESGGGLPTFGACPDACAGAGACCLGPAGCVFVVRHEECLSPSGIFLGAGSVCAGGSCDDLPGCGAFAETSNYAAGASPDGVVMGDLDGDGDLDLATPSDNFPWAVSVLLNNGDGTFAPAVAYDAGMFPTAIAIGDVDGDGNLDLATANRSSDDVSVLINNGDGTFAPAVAYPVGVFPLFLTISDLDGDGDADIAVANFTDDNVSVLLNNGDGTFAPDVTYAAGVGPGTVDDADLDGDGDLDLTVTNFEDNAISVLMNNGDGTFAPAVSYSPGAFPTFVVSGDLDGDGDLDLAVANLGDQTIAVLLNDGGGVFAGPISYNAVGLNIGGLAVGDIDGDGDLDLASTNSSISGMVFVFLNNGDGTFIASPGYDTGATPTNVAIGDLDGDGDLDLATSNFNDGTVSVLLQECGACCLDAVTCTLASAITCDVQGGVFYGDGVECTATLCAIEAGACCLDDGSCLVLSEFNCTAVFGNSFAPGLACADAACAQPPPAMGGCCQGTDCTPQTLEQCLATGGTYLGDDVGCQDDGDTVCFELALKAACCLNDGSCVVAFPADCTGMSGTPGDLDTDCSAPNCPPPPPVRGSCCLPDGNCTTKSVTVQQCNALGGQYQGDGSDSADGCTVSCTAFGACCLQDGSCVDQRTADDCDAAGGSYRGDATVCVVTSCASPGRATPSTKGSLLVIPGIELRFGGGAGPGNGSGNGPGGGAITQDTFISLTNDFPEDVRVQMYYVNGDPPLAADPVTGERAHPGWNYVDNAFTLTGDQPTYWSVLTGLPAVGGLAPFTALDPGFPPGRPANDGTGDRVLRGFLVVWAVNAANEEIRWNHLKGEATTIDYLRGCASESSSVNYPVVDPTVAHGQPTGTPGVLNLNGIEYAQSYAQLLMNFQAPGAAAFSGPRQVISDTTLTLQPVSADLRQEGDGPITTKANFNVWNMNEVKFSGTHRCVTCWDQTLLSQYDDPNNFVLEHLQTPHGKARIDGLGSQVCDVDADFDDGACGNHPDDVCSIAAPLQGVVTRLLTYDGGMDHGAAAVNLVGMGLDPTGVIQYDVLAPPPESVIPSTPRELIDWLETQLRTTP